MYKVLRVPPVAMTVALQLAAFCTRQLCQNGDLHLVCVVELNKAGTLSSSHTPHLTSPLFLYRHGLLIKGRIEFKLGVFILYTPRPYVSAIDSTSSLPLPLLSLCYSVTSVFVSFSWSSVIFYCEYHGGLCLYMVWMKTVSFLVLQQPCYIAFRSCYRLHFALTVTYMLYPYASITVCWIFFHPWKVFLCWYCKTMVSHQHNLFKFHNFTRTLALHVSRNWTDVLYTTLTIAYIIQFCWGEPGVMMEKVIWVLLTNTNCNVQLQTSNPPSVSTCAKSKVTVTLVIAYVHQVFFDNALHEGSLNYQVLNTVVNIHY